MKQPTLTVGSFEAKTHLADLIKKAQSGQTIRITQRGKPAADLVPIAIEEQGSRSAAAHKILQFMKDSSVKAAVDIKALINQGRD